MLGEVVSQYWLKKITVHTVEKTTTTALKRDPRRVLCESFFPMVGLGGSPRKSRLLTFSATYCNFEVLVFASRDF